MPIPPSLNSPRAAIMVVFTAFGTAVGSLAGSMPAVTRAAGVDSLALGLAITLSSIATVSVMALGGTLGRHASNRQVLLLGLPCFALLLTVLLTSTSVLVFFASFIVLGFMFGFVDIAMNSEGTAIERDVQTPIFSAFHGCVSAGVLVFAILSSYLAVETGTWATALAMSIAFIMAWLMVQRIVVPRPLASGAASRISSLPHTSPLVLLGLAAGLIIAGEMAALLWSAKLLDEQAPHLSAIAGLGAAFFGLCNALVRFAGDRLRGRFGDLPLMMGSLVVAIAGFAVLGVSRDFSLSVAGFAAVGLGTAVLIPCIFTLAAGLVPGNRAGGIGFVSMIAGIPRIFAPWAFGWVAAGLGISAAFGLLALALCVALALVAILRHRT